MRMKHQILCAFSRCFLFSPVALLLILITVSAQDHYLPAGKPDVLTLLPQPPAADSPEQAADLAG